MPRPYISKYLKNNKAQKTPKNIYTSKYLSGTPRTGLNPYFSFNNENYDTSGEINLVKQLQQEQIRMYGYNVTYILRTNNTMDELYGESIGSTFKHSFRIEVMPETPELMMGRDSIMPYGYAMTDQVVLHVSFDRIIEEIRKLNVEDREYPKAGDLVAWDIPGNIMEVLYVEDKVIPFAKGTWTMYALTCQVFNLNGETFDTGDENIDFLNNFDKVYEYPHADNEHIRKEAENIVVNEPNTWNLDFKKPINYK